MAVTRSIYRVVRSVLFSIILTVMGLLALLYVIISIPAVQNKIRIIAEKELTSFLGGKVTIAEIEIFPFNELRLHDVTIYTPEGEKCISVERLGAGIELWNLITTGNVRITYAEIISMNASVEQKAPEAPLNIQFLIDAFRPKEKKEPSKIEVVLHNVVIRKSSISYRKSWKPKSGLIDKIDFNNIELSDVNADISVPLIKNNDFTIFVRRLAFVEKSGFDLRSLSVNAHITPNSLSVKNLKVKVGSSIITVSDQKYSFQDFKHFTESLNQHTHNLQITASPLLPSDFSPFFPKLEQLSSPLSCDISLNGTLKCFDIQKFQIKDQKKHFNIDINGLVQDITSPETISAELSKVDIDVSTDYSEKIRTCLTMIPQDIDHIISGLGDISCRMSGSLDMTKHISNIKANVNTSLGELETDGLIAWQSSGFSISDLSVHSPGFNLKPILDKYDLSYLAVDASGNLSLSGKMIQGNLSVFLPEFVFKGTKFENLSLEVEKKLENIKGHLEIDNPQGALSADGDVTLSGPSSEWKLNASVKHLFPFVLGAKGFKADQSFSAQLQVALKGNSPDNLRGNVTIDDFVYKSLSKELTLGSLNIDASVDGLDRIYTISSELVKGHISGKFLPMDLIAVVHGELHHWLPAFIAPVEKKSVESQYADFNIKFNNSDKWNQLVKLSVQPGVPIELSGRVESNGSDIHCELSAPYLIMGTNKLIKGTKVVVDMSETSPLKIYATSNIPLKHDRGTFCYLAEARVDKIGSALSWVMDSNVRNKGNIDIDFDIIPKTSSHPFGVRAEIMESGFSINGADWKISPAIIDYSGKNLSVSDMSIAHEQQYLEVSGKASDDPNDKIIADFSDIDLEYIFNILNINYVNFGGIATGRAVVSNIFSDNPIAYTQDLKVNDLAYNDCVLGDGNLEGKWDNKGKKISILANIQASDTASARVNGDIYLKRDSLSFDFYADKVNIKVLQPFMSGFTSEVKGKASGHVKMYGTFSDIDLVGAAFADTVTMKVDYSNVYYSASDSVLFRPGRIIIPKLKLYDSYGNHAWMQGEVRHRFLHDPTFDFQLTDARNLLVYDTDKHINPIWYGHVFGNGNATLIGRPGLVALDIKMSTAPDSEFTIELDETQTAYDYTFLTFSDRRKELQIVQQDTVTFEDVFMKQFETSINGRADLFSIDLALDVNPNINIVIVMDPDAGDKIRATGNGALQLHYNTDSDNLSVYGKYTLDKGLYNFSLQDLILKNFTIRPGSSISFNGDPYNGILDIVATHRVNTNLADLDISFKNDPDLNRTVVPVDAVLKVSGNLDTPDLKFDIDLPTVTSEVERKLHSIISTEDMMNRQVIYLLALNRFYSPDYASGERGGEFASVASSTLSSQIQNIIGSMTDKVSLAPSIKSDKSDLSDMEFDVALSSSLFDDRLLLNGNLGYRDKSTSQTTFIGDFDLEYLLSRNGQLRLKAYNHFNDASYYLKSALTTQGIGLIYRKDFNDPFSFLKKLFRKKNNKRIDSESKREK